MDRLDLIDQSWWMDGWLGGRTEDRWKDGWVGFGWREGGEQMGRWIDRLTDNGKVIHVLVCLCRKHKITPVGCTLEEKVPTTICERFKEK